MTIAVCLSESQPAKTAPNECNFVPDLSSEMQSQRVLLVGQLRLLLQRAERRLRIDRRSVLNLLRVYVTLLRLGAA
jgi:hypothetical protein